jgi:mannose-6-phosphate isomerase-like protein (cupin superfamily)
VARSARVWSAEELRDEHAVSGRLYHEVLRVEALSAGIYVLEAGAGDRQVPHREDEVYLVVTGRGAFVSDEMRAEVSQGSLVYVPKAIEHRFVDITEELVLLVLFAPPESPS